ncbi:MAG: DUF4249 family protein [Bacteroidota bacterium]
MRIPFPHNLIPFFLFTIILSLTNCTKETASLETIDDLVVQGYLRPEQPVDDFKVTRIISLASEIQQQEAVDRASVTITTEGAVYELTSIGDGIYQNLNFIPEAGRVYELAVTFEDKMITATTFVPLPPENIRISATEVTRKKIEGFGDVDFTNLPEPIEVNWEDNSSNYYFVVVSNTEENPEPVNALFGENERPTFTNEPEITTTFFINSFQFFSHYGRYEVEVFRVNPEYVTLYENVSTGQGALNEVTTNISGGFGIFTGVSSAKLEIVVTKG